MASHLRKRSISCQNISRSAILSIVTCVLSCLAIQTSQSLVYTVIIDAGSTGSRVQVFSFNRSISNASLTLDDELYVAIQPGLSSYANEPAKGAESLQVLLDAAKAFLPQSEWGVTPLSLKATAGLRLLPKEKSDRLLDECKKLFDNSGFLISQKSVSIMSGTEEGIFSWFTVNFLLNRLSSQGHRNTLAALDLGGGSTQVTFETDDKNVEDRNQDIVTINAVPNNISVYTHSYLGMGILAARKGILSHGQNVDNVRKNDPSTSVIELRSECVNPVISTNWHYGGVEYLVKGPINGSSTIVNAENRPIVRFSECLKIVRNYVGARVNKPQGLKDSEIIAFSYYFDRAVAVGLIDPFTGGVITADSYLRAATRTCDYPNTDRPFLCLDLTYIHVLLQDGFNLQPTTKLHLYQEINNHTVSWALGAAINLMHNSF